MSLYRKKPVTIEALQWDGRNTREIHEFGKGQVASLPDSIVVKVFDSVQLLRPGDYLIRNSLGECCPCRKDIFEQTYEPVDYPPSV